MSIAAPVPIPPSGSARMRSDRTDTLRRLLASKTFLIGSLVLLFWIGAALFGTAFTKSAYDSSENTLQGISSAHWFGTDKLGRDVFARVIAGSREIMVVATFATILGVVGGTVLGLVTGYFGKWVDNALSRIIDAVLAIPLVVTAVVVVTALGISNVTLILTIGGIFTPLIARTVRTAVLVERDLDYVQAAKLRGERAPYIMFVEILPNVTAPILVEATVRLGYAIFFIASLSFIGYGVQPPSPDWGAQVADNYTLISFAWWTVLFPSLAIASLVISVNLISDGVTHVVDT
jgi:peptide/nickel transport system permease protein